MEPDNNLRVIYVEDDPEMIDLIKLILKSPGF